MIYVIIANDAWWYHKMHRELLNFDEFTTYFGALILYENTDIDALLHYKRTKLMNWE